MSRPLNPLTVGFTFDDGEPCVLICMANEWRTLPHANAVLFVRQIIDVIDAIQPQNRSLKLTHCAEYGPYVEGRR